LLRKTVLYFLYAKTEEEKNKWDEAFSTIVGKKNENEKKINVRNSCFNNNDCEEYTIFKVCHTQTESHFSSRKTSGDSNKDNKINYKFKKNDQELNLIQRKNSVVTYSNPNNKIDLDKNKKKRFSFFY
jgi:hypothetical protein